MASTSSSTSDHVSVVGTGAIGSAAARAILRAGRSVVVWNRTTARTAPLVAEGAGLAASLEDAFAHGAPVVLALSGHAQAMELLDALADDHAGRTVVALVGGAPEEARGTAARAAAAGLDYLQAGIQASPDTIGTPAASFLYSGPRSAFERHRDVLEALGRARFVGDRPEAAAVWDLALFGLWYDAQVGLLRALATARDAGIDLVAFADTAGEQLGHVVAGVDGTTRELGERDYPAGPATLADHEPVVARLLGLRDGTALGDGGLAAVLERISARIAAGGDKEGLTALADPSS